jgi:hypothetical protein
MKAATSHAAIPFSRRDARNGLVWIKRAYVMFRAASLRWLSLLFTYYLLIALLEFGPVQAVGQFIAPLLKPVFAVGFLAAGRAPSCVVVAAGGPLPSELDPDAPVAAKLNCWCERGAIAGFKGFAPSEPLRVGIYDDGRLVGSTDVPATAPLLADERPTPPSGRVGEIIPDPPVHKPGEPVEDLVGGIDEVRARAVRLSTGEHP